MSYRGVKKFGKFEILVFDSTNWDFYEHKKQVRKSQWLKKVGGAAFLPHKIVRQECRTSYIEQKKNQHKRKMMRNTSSETLHSTHAPSLHLWFSVKYLVSPKFVCNFVGKNRAERATSLSPGYHAVNVSLHQRY